MWLDLSNDSNGSDNVDDSPVSAAANGGAKEDNKLTEFFDNITRYGH